MMIENIIHRSIHFMYEVVGKLWLMPMKLEIFLGQADSVEKKLGTHKVAWTRRTVRLT